MAQAVPLIDSHLRRVRLSLRRLAVQSTPEDVHQARVAMRRLRTILADVADSLGAEPADRLLAELRSLSRELGKVRDADIRARILLPVLQAIDRDAGDAVNRAARSLERKLHADCRESRRGMRASLRTLPGPVAALRVTDLLAGSAPANSRKQLDALLARALQRRWKRMLKALQHNPASAARRHALRIRVKKCRYLLEARRASSLPPPLAGALRRLRRLQDRLGNLNDLAQLRRWLNQQALEPALSALLQEKLRARKRQQIQGLERQQRKLLQQTDGLRA